MSGTCFVEQLKKLKVSSKESVDNLDEFSDFKSYMHIKRDAEDELYHLLMKASESPWPQLVLVCGGVGDGKSHIISYLKHCYPQLISHFDLHNDATESFHPKKTSIDTLNDVLSPFSDSEIGSGNAKKMILAINLGALNNFIDSRYQNNFNRLKSFVEENHILESGITNINFQGDSSFQFINFSDFHLYSLTEHGPESKFMEQAFEKITQMDMKNPFFQAYQTTCQTCPSASSCPIRANYVFFQDSIVKATVVQTLIEGMMKHRLIISTRSLFNFVYDILVPNELDQIPISSIPEITAELTPAEHTRHIIPSLFFDHPDLSTITEVMHELDPVRMRSEKIDELYIMLHTREKIGDYLDQVLEELHFPYLQGRFSSQIPNSLSHASEDISQKEELVRLFLRMCHFRQRDDLVMLGDPIYLDFTKNLFLWNIGGKSKLRPLYTQIKEAIYLWNGEAERDHVNLFLGKNQLLFKITQFLELSPYVLDLVEQPVDILSKFSPVLALKFKVGTDQVYSIDIDFSLYSLLMRIRKGYRPNKKDKASFINFVEFMDKLLPLGSQNKELLFEERTGSQLKYKLFYDADFGEYNFVRVGS